MILLHFLVLLGVLELFVEFCLEDEVLFLEAQNISFGFCLEIC